MAISLVNYLNFAGNTREAFSFYQSIFGGELVLSSFGDFGMEGMPAEGIMHAELRHDDFTLMASDAMAGAEESWKATRVYCAFMSDGSDQTESEKLQDWFQKLGEGGHVGQPLEKQVWGDMYGNLTDRYGIEWMFNISMPQGWTQQNA